MIVHRQLHQWQDSISSRGPVSATVHCYLSPNKLCLSLSLPRYNTPLFSKSLSSSSFRCCLIGTDISSPFGLTATSSLFYPIQRTTIINTVISTRSFAQACTTTIVTTITSTTTYHNHHCRPNPDSSRPRRPYERQRSLCRSINSFLGPYSAIP